MGWNDLSTALFGGTDDGRLMSWIQSPTVSPYIEELQKFITFGDPTGKRGPDRATIIRLCLESKEADDGRFTKDHPANYDTMSKAERYARAVSLIIRENSYEGGLLRGLNITYQQKCDLIITLIGLIRQESSGARRGRFNPERAEGDTVLNVQATLKTAEDLAKARKAIMLKELIVVNPLSFATYISGPPRSQMWTGLPVDEKQYQELIEVKEGYLAIPAKQVLIDLDIAGAFGIREYFAARTEKSIIAAIQERYLLEEYQAQNSEILIYGILRASQEKELQKMQQAHTYFSIYGNKGPSYTDCMAKLGILDGERPWMRNTAPTCVFFPFQIQGIAWLLEMIKSPIRGAILADDMGLGKTFQAAGLIQALVNERESDADPVATYGDPKVSLIVVPPIVLSAWEDVLRSNFPQLTLTIYGPGTEPLSANDLPVGESAAKHVVLSTYAIMERHALKVRNRWEKDHPTLPWPQNLTGSIGCLVLDEAHCVKAAQRSVRWSALKILHAKYTIAMTGTLCSNTTDDIAGPLGLISNDSLWRELNTNLNTNPFNFPLDDKRAALQCTTGALDGWIKRCKDPIKKGLWIQKMLRQLMRKTTYETVFRGRRVGEAIPPMREQIVELDYGSDVLPTYQAAARELGKKLITVELKNESLVVQFHMDIHRTLTVINIWHPLELISTIFTVKRVSQFRSKAGDLRTFLLMMEDQSTYQWTGKKSVYNSLDIELVSEIVRLSPLIRFTMTIIRNIVIVMGRKLIIWADYPLSQLFIELVVAAAGIETRSLHSGLKLQDRDDLIRTFNTTNSTLAVLVMSTLIGNVGINLQHSCSDQVMLGTTASDPQERQCLARIHRFGQVREVMAWKPVTKDSYAEGQRLKRFLKVVADLVAHLDVDRLKNEGVIGAERFEYDIKEEIKMLWLELQGAVGMPQAPSWLGGLDFFSLEGEDSEV